MAKISDEMVNQIVELYSELKNYSAVGRKLHIAPTTVAKYVNLSASIKQYTRYYGPEPTLPTLESIQSFGKLTDSENESYKAWLKEYYN